MHIRIINKYDIKIRMPNINTLNYMRIGLFNGWASLKALSFIYVLCYPLSLSLYYSRINVNYFLLGHMFYLHIALSVVSTPFLSYRSSMTRLEWYFPRIVRTTVLVSHVRSIYYIICGVTTSYLFYSSFKAIL